MSIFPRAFFDLNFLYAGLTTVSRALFGFVLVVVLARYMSVSEFGEITFLLVLSNILVLIVDYGYNILLPKEAVSTPNQVGTIVARAAWLKMALSGLTLVSVSVGISLWNTDPAFLSAALVFTAAAICNSFAIFYLVPFRAVEKFEKEMVGVFLNNALVVVVTFIVLRNQGDLIHIGYCFLAIKLLFAIASRAVYLKYFGRTVWRPTTRSLWEDLQKGAPYAIHVAVGALYLSVDTLILKLYVDNHALGIYQSGIRLIGAASLGLGAINSIMIPRFTRAMASGSLIQMAVPLNIAVIAAGLVGSVMLYLLKGTVVDIIYTSKFREVLDYFLPLTIIIMLRYFGVLYGVLLTISDHQRIRAWAVSGTLVWIIVADFVVIPEFGLLGAIYVLLSAHVLLNSIYVCAVYGEFGRLFLFTPRVPK